MEGGLIFEFDCDRFLNLECLNRFQFWSKGKSFLVSLFGSHGVLLILRSIFFLGRGIERESERKV